MRWNIYVVLFNWGQERVDEWAIVLGKTLILLFRSLDIGSKVLMMTYGYTHRTEHLSTTVREALSSSRWQVQQRLSAGYRVDNKRLWRTLL